ncbi:MAG TPA: hypothetical protein VGD40_11370 [Chryseosolibacter sp.]
MNIDNRDIFEQIGNAFYAVAADQHVKPLEVGELKLLISNDWLPRTTAGNEALVSDEAHSIIMAIDSLQTAQTKSNDAFKEFASFYHKHPDVFSNDLKERIVKTARDIVKIFKADNRKPNRHLEALKNLFQLQKQITL